MELSVSTVGEVFAPKTDEEKARDKKEIVVDDEAVKALQAKIAKPLFEVNVRLLASAGSQFQADDILAGLTAGFSQFASPTRNEFRVVKAAIAKKSDNAIYLSPVRVRTENDFVIRGDREFLSFADFVDRDAAREVAEIERSCPAGKFAESRFTAWR